MDTHPYTVIIRRATEADAPALEELAQLEGGRRIGADDVLIAEVGDEVRAAMRVGDDTAIADPFRPTQGLVDLLRARAAMLRDCRGESRTRGHAFRRLLPHLIQRTHVHVS